MCGGNCKCSKATKFKKGDRVVGLVNCRSGVTKTGDVHTVVDICDNTGVVLIDYYGIRGWCYDYEIENILEEPNK